MKRLILLAIFVPLFLTQTANAELAVLNPDIKSDPILLTPAPKAPNKTLKKPHTHTIKRGDTLTKLAKKYKTSVKRLWDKNKSLKHPDQLEVGDKLKIPSKEEKLKSRPTPDILKTVTSRSQSPQVAGGFSGLMGSIGSVSPYGNCVKEPGVNNPGSGNPINWPVLTQTPSIGATALWTYNHTGVVTGIWSNGDLEVRHQNFKGMRTRFARSEFRGFR